MAFTSSQAMPMLSVPEKKTSFLDLHKFLSDHISSNFSSHDASASERELSHIRQMRSDIEKQRNPSPSSAGFRLDLLLQYYRAICVIERQLDCVNSIPFTWQDAFRSNKKSSLQSINFEKAAILFNIGAVYSQIGSMTERNTEEGRKAAYVEFQKAAGVFRLLKENAVVGATVDLTAECAGMLEILMLAQAQECMFDKAFADSKGVTLCSKVAKQAGNFYIEAYSALTLRPLDQHFDRAWISHAQLKTAYFYAEAVSLYCIDLHLNEDIGQEIARLKLSISSLSDAKKSAKGAPSSLLEAASKLETKMKQNLETAVKENNQIYLMQITPVNSLSELPAAVLAQHAPVEGLDMSSETLFSNLISESNKKALTKYTEMIDDVLQSQLDKIKLAKDVCKGKLQEMGLPDSIGAVETDCTIPAELKAQVEAIQDRDGSGGLQVLLRQLMDLRKVNLELTEQMEKMLQNEEKEDSQYRDQYKEKWNRPESGVLSKEIRDMLSKYAENLREAGVSDLKIEQSMSENFGILAILDIQPIESALPSLPWPVTYVDGSEDRTLNTLKLSLTKLETLEAQLESLEKKLKELKKQKDDVLPKLLGGASLEEVLKEEKKRLNPICEEISKHIEMVEQLLLEIQDQNSKFVDHFRPDEYIISLKTLEQIPTAVAKFREIKENLKEGIKFYVSLQEALDTLKQRSSDFVMTRGMQCHEMEEILKQPGGWRLLIVHN